MCIKGALYRAFFRSIGEIPGWGNPAAPIFAKSENLTQLLLHNYDYLFDSVDGRKMQFVTDGAYSIDGEFNEEVKTLAKELNINLAKDDVFPFTYFGNLLSVFLDCMNKGEQCLTSSIALESYLRAYFCSSFYDNARTKISEELNVHPNIIFEALKIVLPNVSKLPSQEILELRVKLVDELAAFKTYLKNFQLDLEAHFDEKVMAVKAKDIVKVKVFEALDDLIEKSKEIKVLASSNILRELRDPKSYSPLILSLTNQVSNTLAIMVSLGLISVSTAIDYYKENKEIRKNGLYYLLKLRSV